MERCPAASASVVSAYTTNGLDQYTAVTGVERTYSGAASAAVSYDALGRPQSETANGATTYFLYDGANLIGEYGVNGNILNRYVPGPGTDEPLTWYTGAGTSSRAWYAADQQGSILQTADQSANPGATTYLYGPYGEPITSAGAPAWGGSRYRYTGQIEIPGTQVYHYKARVYDPAVGKFYQTDPIGMAGGTNSYSYALGDPINLTDPTGQFVGSDFTSLGNGCYAETDWWDVGTVDDNGGVTISGYHSTALIGVCGGQSGGSGNGGTGGAGGKPDKPQNGHSCPGVDFSAGGSLNGALISPGGSVGAGLIVHVPLDFRHGWQVSVIGQGTFTWGLGAFLGAGASFGFPAPSSTLPSGGSTFRTGDFIVEGGWGPAASVEVQGNSIGSSASMGGPHLGPGAGYGAYVGKGTAWGARYTSPAGGC